MARMARRVWIAVWLGLGLAISGCVKSGEYQPWMSADVQAAWDAGYDGDGTSIIVVDEYTGDRFTGNLSGNRQNQTHGDWTALQAGMIAFAANVIEVDYNRQRGQSYSLRSGLNVINNSYSIDSPTSYALADFDRLERTTIGHAQNGRAVVVKAAGNDSVAVDGVNIDGDLDVFNQALIGAPSAIFVGALERNGTDLDPAPLADYSNFAGGNSTVQGQFLVVGVDESITGLAGTSFAAPIVSGYAAILGSKFTTATPTQIADQLLDTARTDTVLGYDPSVHGRGEASLSRALAPASLN